ncbi:PTS sugar transporter subunit IIC [Psychrilyobacter atlanticus]|uniref:PTS sugar transporter subunit IIC n=1 Tax=Psychrilyobacter atlanticus TaxID=271091 RepID=UPI000400D9DF|nr:PTS sugar transporter subunit IIC [Psychrilyobacter atlanticus]
MAAVMEKINKILPHVMKFVNSKAVTAMKEGFLMTMPLTIIGSVFLLLAFVPISGYEGFMAGIFGAEWQSPLFQVVGATFDLLALVGVFGIAYCYVVHEGIDGAVNAGILGIVSLITVMKSFVEAADGTQIGGVIPKAFLGGRGMIASIIIGLAVGKIYSFVIKKKWTIKLPDSVPTGVSNAFTSLIPGFIIITISFLTFIFFKVGFQKTFIEVIYSLIQTPLQGMTDSFAGVILIPVLISLLWWCGIHGSGIIMGIMGPIVMANAIHNQTLVNAGTDLVAGENARIVTQQFVDQFITVGGSGLTLGLVVSMLIFAKSTQYKQLGRLAIVPGLFNINEPVIFAAPIVFNPIMFIPFVLAPLCSALLVYGCISLGIVEPFTGVLVPWTTPIILGGFIVGGFKAALLQFAVFIMTIGIYFPFFKYQDNMAYLAETGGSDAKEAMA